MSVTEWKRSLFWKTSSKNYPVTLWLIVFDLASIVLPRSTLSTQFHCRKEFIGFMPQLVAGSTAMILNQCYTNLMNVFSVLRSYSHRMLPLRSQPCSDLWAQGLGTSLEKATRLKSEQSSLLFLSGLPVFCNLRRNSTNPSPFELHLLGIPL